MECNVFLLVCNGNLMGLVVSKHCFSSDSKNNGAVVCSDIKILYANFSNLKETITSIPMS